MIRSWGLRRSTTHDPDRAIAAARPPEGADHDQLRRRGPDRPHDRGSVRRPDPLRCRTHDPRGGVGVAVVHLLRDVGVAGQGTHGDGLESGRDGQRAGRRGGARHAHPGVGAPARPVVARAQVRHPLPRLRRHRRRRHAALLLHRGADALGECRAPPGVPRARAHRRVALGRARAATGADHGARGRPLDARARPRPRSLRLPGRDAGRSHRRRVGARCRRLRLGLLRSRHARPRTYRPSCSSLAGWSSPRPCSSRPDSPA